MSSETALTAAPWSEGDEMAAREYVRQMGPMFDGGLLSRALATLDRDRSAATARIEALIAAGDALNLAGGSRNAGEPGPERDALNRKNWYEASSAWNKAAFIETRRVLQASKAPDSREGHVKMLDSLVPYCGVHHQPWASRPAATPEPAALDVEGLEQAWAEALAATDQGMLSLERISPNTAWGAQGWTRYPVKRVRETGPTPAAALQALTTALREVTP